jgi:membrane-associated phospholipid phosphatase
MKKNLTYFILLLSPLLAFSQDTLSPISIVSYSTDSLFSLQSQKGYITSLLHNIGEQTASPFHASKKDWLVTGASLAITGLLISYDGDIDEWARVQKQQSGFVNYVSPRVTLLGSNVGIYGIIGFGALSTIFKYNKGIQTSLLATQTMITSGIWVHAIKLLSLRERPDQSYKFRNFEDGKWYGPGYLIDHDSYKSVTSLNAFVSGHTATVFSIATVIATEYKDTRLVPLVAYSSASLAGLSRLTEHRHWASDVFAGAVLGYVCGKQESRHFHQTHSISANGHSSVHKAIYSVFERQGQLGLRLIWK